MMNQILCNYNRIVYIYLEKTALSMLNFLGNFSGYFKIFPGIFRVFRGSRPGKTSRPSDNTELKYVRNQK